MAKVKFPFYSLSARGTLITQTTSPPRGRKRRRFKPRSPPRSAEDIHKGPMAGAIVYQRNGTVKRS
mgnify:CR=1 FL=1